MWLWRVIFFFFLGAVFAMDAPQVRAAPAFVLLDAPFTSQAPFGNWASPWQDFCEEASVVMAAHFLKKLPLSPHIADLQMRIIKQYEELMWGRSKDTTVEEAALVLRVLYGAEEVETRTISSSEDIKRELAAGRLIIAPVAGRLLKNPYFVPPGPVYHMVVIKGFDDARGVFITNDPGTRRGNGFMYKQSLLFEAIHDWNGGEVMRGEKKIAVVGR